MARLAQVLLGNKSKIYWRATNAAGDGTGAFVRIPSAAKISLPQLDSEEIDVSDLDSEGDVKEVTLGDTDPGTSTLELHWNPSNTVHMGLFDALIAKTVHEFKVEIPVDKADPPTVKTCTWKGRIKSLPAEVERNTPIKPAMEIRNTGLPAWS